MDEVGVEPAWQLLWMVTGRADETSPHIDRDPTTKVLNDMPSRE
jgi:hypothetical protein